MSTITITNNTNTLLNTISTLNVGTYIDNLTVRERINLGLTAISDLNKYTAIDYQAGGYLAYGLTSATTYKVDLDDWSITYSGLNYTSSGGSIINKIAAYQYSTGEYTTVEGIIQYAGAPFFSGLIDGSSFSSIRISSPDRGVGLGLDAQWAGEYIVGTIKSMDSAAFSKEYQAGNTSIFYSDFLQGAIGFRLAGTGADSLNSAITSGTFNYVQIGLYDGLSSTFTDTIEIVDLLYDLNKTADEAVNFSGDDTVYLKGRYGSEYSTLGGNDTIYSSPGNDIIDGGTGTDTVVYLNGGRNQYTVTSSVDGNVVVTSGIDGTDTLRSIEKIQFIDELFDINSLLDDGGSPSAESSTLDVIVDLFGTVSMLKGLIEVDNGTVHTISYNGTVFNYADVDPLITTVVRNGEFTAEFAQEIADAYPSVAGIKYSVAVGLVGVTALDNILISIAGADGSYVS